MTLLFNRKYNLVIANTPPKQRSVLLAEYSEVAPLREGSIITSEGVVTARDDRTEEIPIDSVEITDLQITANIKSSANGKGSTGTEICIYNLSPQTLAVVGKPNNSVILRAGYAEDEELRIVFTGQVQTFETTKEGKDLVTKLHCVDGQLPLNTTRVSKSFGITETYGDVIEWLVEQYEANGIARGEVLTCWDTPPQDYVTLPAIRQKPISFKLLMGYSVTGYLHQALDNLCEELGYVNYITNGKIFVHPKNHTATVEEYEFSANQMKSIRPFGSTATNSSISEGVTGIKIVTFLDGRLDVDKRVKILDGEYADSYKIVSKSHLLNYESGEWDTTVTCNKVKSAET